MREEVRKVVMLLICSSGLMVSIACNKSAQSTPQAASPPSSAKHYQLKGKVVSVDKPGKTVNVDSEAIPGFMNAMTMPYQVKPESELDKLHPGDLITADLISQSDNAWLENVTLTGHSPAPASK